MSKTTTKTTTWQKVEAEIAEATDRYHKLSSSPSAKARDIALEAENLDKLKRKLAETMAAGAKPCPSCKGPAIGMRKNALTYEIGCPACEPVVQKDEGTISFSSRAGSLAEAVERWNDRIFVRKDKNGVVTAID